MENDLKNALGDSLFSSLEDAQRGHDQEEGTSQIAEKRQRAISAWMEAETEDAPSIRRFVKRFSRFSDKLSLW